MKNNTWCQGWDEDFNTDFSGIPTPNLTGSQQICQSNDENSKVMSIELIFDEPLKEKFEEVRGRETRETWTDYLDGSGSELATARKKLQKYYKQIPDTCSTVT